MPAFSRESIHNVTIIMEENGVEYARVHGTGPTPKDAVAVATRKAASMVRRASAGRGR